MLTSSFVYAADYKWDGTYHWSVDSSNPENDRVKHDFEDGKCKTCGYVMTLKPVETTVDNQFGVNGDITSNGITINGVEGVGTYKVSTIINKDQTNNKMTDILDKYRGLISALSGGGALTMLLFFIINFGKLGASAGNPQQRQSALMGLLFTGIATALLGSIMIFFQFFYHALG